MEVAGAMRAHLLALARMRAARAPASASRRAFASRSASSSGSGSISKGVTACVPRCRPHRCPGKLFTLQPFNAARHEAVMLRANDRCLSRVRGVAVHLDELLIAAGGVPLHHDGLPRVEPGVLLQRCTCRRRRPHREQRPLVVDTALCPACHSPNIYFFLHFHHVNLTVMGVESGR